MIWSKLKGWLSKRKYKLIISLVSLFYPTKFCYMPPCGEGMGCIQAFTCETKFLIQMFKISPGGALIKAVISYLLTYFIISLIFSAFKKKEKRTKILKKTIIGGLIGLIVGLLPLLALVWDIAEYLIILVFPLMLILGNEEWLIKISTPIFYAIIGALIGCIISKRKKK